MIAASAGSSLQRYYKTSFLICLGTSQKVEGAITVMPSIFNISFDFGLCQNICLFFIFTFNINLVIRNVSSLLLEMKSCAPFLQLLVANSLIGDPNCAVLVFNQIRY